MADSYGHADVMRGWIEGDRLIFEIIGDPPVRLRLTWDISDPADMIYAGSSGCRLIFLFHKPA